YDLGQLGAFLLERLFPGNPLPLSASPLPPPRLRIQQPGGGVHQGRMPVALLTAARIAVGQAEVEILEPGKGAGDLFAYDPAAPHVNAKRAAARQAIDPVRAPLARIPLPVILTRHR